MFYAAPILRKAVGVMAKKAKVSPMQRSLNKLREDGYRPAIVEYRVPFKPITKDLWGVVDILAINEQETLAIQCTTSSNMAARVTKARESVDLVTWLQQTPMHRFEVWGWLKRANRWCVRRLEVRPSRAGARPTLFLRPTIVEEIK